MASALFLPRDATAWTTTFVEVLGRFGVEAATVRQSLARARSRDFLASERVGSRTRWRLTAEAARRFEGSRSRAMAFESRIRDWDRRWLVLLASVPERDRAARHLLRTRLAWAGLGSPSPGVWIGTHTSRQAEVERILRVAGIADRTHLFVAEHVGASPTSGMVAQAWDLDALAEDYTEFLASFAEASSVDPLVSVVRLWQAWTRLVSLDPELPGDLLPPQWYGTAAVSLFRERFARWEPEAKAEWKKIDHRHGH